MPNWCFTNYVFEGNKDEITDLYNKLQSLTNADKSLVENNFGKEWLGNVVTLFGGNYEEVNCRGEFIDLEHIDNTLHFSTQTAWSECDETWQLVCKHYPSITYYYQAEESGNNYYVTNDVEGIYFPERFLAYQWECGSEYLITEKDLLNHISKITNTTITNRTELNAIIASVNQLARENNDDSYIYCNEIKVVETLKKQQNV